jgi:hypothetical protein
MKFWAPFKYFKTKTPATVVLLRAGWLNRLLLIVNALVQMRAGKGIKITKAEAGWVIESEIVTHDASTEHHWLLICRNVAGVPTRFYMWVQCSNLRTAVPQLDGTYTVGVPVTGTPYTVDTPPEP